jgi:hypothetical protein
MRTVLHLVGTDLRRLWPLGVLLAAIHTVRAFSMEWALVWSPRTPSTGVPDGADGVALLAEILLCVLTISFVVHADPLVGTSAFWLTRPSPRRASSSRSC